MGKVVYPIREVESRYSIQENTLFVSGGYVHRRYCKSLWRAKIIMNWRKMLGAWGSKWRVVDLEG